MIAAMGSEGLLWPGEQGEQREQDQDSSVTTGRVFHSSHLKFVTKFGGPTLFSNPCILFL